MSVSGGNADCEGGDGGEHAGATATTSVQPVEASLLPQSFFVCHLIV